MALPFYQIQTKRLDLRSINPSEVSQLRIIRSDPKNNKFEAIPDPRTRERSLAQGITYAAEQGIVDLLVIMRPESFSSEKDFPTKHQLLMVEGGVAIGLIQICPPDTEDSARASEVGGYIHHEFNGLGYGKEAFRAAIDFALTELGRNIVMLETKPGNLGFRALMRSLNLEDLEKPGSIWTNDNFKKAGGRGEESV